MIEAASATANGNEFRDSVAAAGCLEQAQRLAGGQITHTFQPLSNSHD
jgi:hypothetical protein